MKDFQNYQKEVQIQTEMWGIGTLCMWFGDQDQHGENGTSKGSSCRWGKRVVESSRPNVEAGQSSAASSTPTP